VPLAPPDVPEDSRVVVMEVAIHLRELADRPIRDRHDVAAVRLKMQLCDDAVLAALEPDDHRRYRDVVAVSPRRHRPDGRSWACRPGVGTDAAHVRVALHRRVILLRSLTR